MRKSSLLRRLMIQMRFCKSWIRVILNLMLLPNILEEDFLIEKCAVFFLLFEITNFFQLIILF